MDTPVTFCTQIIGEKTNEQEKERRRQISAAIAKVANALLEKYGEGRIQDIVAVANHYVKILIKK